MAMVAVPVVLVPLPLMQTCCQSRLQHKQRGGRKAAGQLKDFCAAPELLKDPMEYLYLCDFLAKGAINSRASYNRALLKLV